ncbi:14885_t:CDS:1, partial [Acaulospora morrowiae]
MQGLHLDEQSYIINTGGLAQSYKDCLPCSRLFPMCQITKIKGNNMFSSEVRRAVQKRRDYGETFNLARKAVRSAVETGGETFCRLKTSLNDWFAKEQRLARIDNDDKENFDSSQ